MALDDGLDFTEIGFEFVDVGDYLDVGFDVLAVGVDVGGEAF